MDCFLNIIAMFVLFFIAGFLVVFTGVLICKTIKGIYHEIMSLHFNDPQT